jgi:UDPglucose--hexose-1-phosphate uridylyltransferase
MPELRVDPLSGRLVAIAPGRRTRPGAEAARIEPVTQEELDSCPFCEGREGQTPPEVFALPFGDREPDTPGWRVRVVPNLYPAFERQEVVVHSPQHVRTFADLTDEDIALVTEAWIARESSAAPPGSYLLPLINEGRAAGASLPHSHSQLVWLPEPPPAIQAEQPDGLAELFESAREQDLIVNTADDLVAFCHPVGRLPYETVIMVTDSVFEPFDSTLAAALRLLRDLVARLRDVEGPVAWNAWLHHGNDTPWHIELVPRLSALAGIELGAGIYVNTLAPEQAAAALRG